MKKILKMAGEEFVYGAHLLSLGASGIVLSVILVLDLKVDLLLLFIAYLIYQVIYTYNHFKELHVDLKTNPERAKSLTAKKKWVQASPFFYFLLLCISLFMTNWQTALLTGFITLGGILYTEYFKRVQILGFKSYYVAFFWGIVVMLVLLHYKVDQIVPFLLLSLFTFIRWIVNTVFFDLKDIESDKENMVKTFPVYWGRPKTIRILHLINLVSLLPLLFGVYFDQLPAISLFLCITVIISFFYLIRAVLSNESQLRLLSYIVVDGEYLLWPLIILIGRLFV